jgi:nitrate reductase NapAB chaperone NapD
MLTSNSGWVRALNGFRAEVSALTVHSVDTGQDIVVMDANRTVTQRQNADSLHQLPGKNVP